MEALNPRQDLRVMVAPRKYPEELRDRVVPVGL